MDLTHTFAVFIFDVQYVLIGIIIDTPTSVHDLSHFSSYDYDSQEPAKNQKGYSFKCVAGA